MRLAQLVLVSLLSQAALLASGNALPIGTVKFIVSSKIARSADVNVCLAKGGRIATDKSNVKWCTLPATTGASAGMHASTMTGSPPPSH